MRRMATIVVGMFVGVTVWGIALAAIPDAGGVIHGCYDTKRGDLRVIDTEVGQTCEKGRDGAVLEPDRAAGATWHS
jgi:hypothetical protein